MEAASVFIDNKGGDIPEFRAAQLKFNRIARSAHAELPESDAKKSAS